MNKIIIFSCLFTIILFSITTVSAELSENKTFLVALEGYSYDYSDNLFWGFNGLIIDLNRQYPNKIDTNYVGLTQVQKQDIYDHPDNWLKAWIRIRIPEPKDVLPSELLAKYETPFDIIPIEVRIQNHDEIGIYSKNLVIMAGNNSDSEEIQKLNVHTAYMEVLIEKRQRTEQEIEIAIQHAQINTDKEGDYETEYDDLTYQVVMDACSRDIKYTEAEVKFYCTKYYQVPLATINYETSFDLPPELIQDVLKHPENYSLLKLDLQMDKNMPWGICTVLSMFSRDNNGIYFFYNSNDDYPCAFNDHLENGKQIPLIGFYILINQTVDENNLDTIIRELNLEIEFSTEFAGEINWNGTPDEKWGYSGPRFVKKIDMSEAVYTESNDNSIRP